GKRGNGSHGGFAPAVVSRLARASPNRGGLMSTEKRSTRPVHEVKVGLVKALVWPNATTTSGHRYNVTIARIYKADDAWKTTQSFGVRDLADVTRAAVLAEAWIREKTLGRRAETA